MAGRVPLANRVVLGLLASPLHRLLDRSVVGLRLRGTRSGQPVVLPVMHAVDDEGLVVLPGHADGKRWWRNLRRPAALLVLTGGAWRPGSGWVLGPGEPGYQRALGTYRRRWPRTPPAAVGPVVRIRLDSTRS